MPRAKAELHTAYMWDCDECGQENFCRSVECAFEEEDREWLAEKGIDMDEEQGNWCTRPTTVKCSKCGTEFEVDEPGIDDGTEEPEAEPL